MDKANRVKQYFTCECMTRKWGLQICHAPKSFRVCDKFAGLRYSGLASEFKNPVIKNGFRVKPGMTIRGIPGSAWNDDQGDSETCSE
jgi:hypothetical protein